MNLKKLVGSLALAAMVTTSVAPLAAAPIDEIQVDAPAKNVIVMIPDGMAIDGVTLTRWYHGGEPLNMDSMASGLVRTHSSDAPIADSAPAATAMATGHKSHTGFVGVLADENTLYGTEPLADADKRRPVANVLEGAQTLGKATGIVSTSEVMHATPAAYSAHADSRKNYDALSEQQVYQGMDVVLGAGSKFFMAENRKDGADLLPIIQDKYQYVTTRDEMMAVNDGKLWGLFAPSALAYEMDRPADQPSIAEMTQKAIDLLNQDEDGFFLMVEGSKIDWAAHANDPIGLVSDIKAFDDAVGVALDFAKADGNTLLIVATDHANSGISIGNKATTGDYDKRPLSDFIDPLKKASLTGEGLEQVLNEDRSNVVEVMAQYYGITDLTEEEIQTIKDAKAGSMNYAVGPMMGKRANIGFTTGGHTGGDVALYVYAPANIDQLTGTVNNSDIADYSAMALGIDLPALTESLFVPSRTAFAAQGADVIWDTETNPLKPQLKVVKGDQEIVFPINTNLAIVNGETQELDGVTVFSGGTTYVPQSAVDLVA